MAVEEGFEPSIPIKVCTLSRGVVSATHPLHRIVSLDCTSPICLFESPRRDGFDRRFSRRSHPFGAPSLCSSVQTAARFVEPSIPIKVCTLELWRGFSHSPTPPNCVTGLYQPYLFARIPPSGWIRSALLTPLSPLRGAVALLQRPNRCAVCRALDTD